MSSTLVLISISYSSCIFFPEKAGVDPYNGTDNANSTQYYLSGFLKRKFAFNVIHGNTVLFNKWRQL